MIERRSKNELELMRESGKLLAEVIKILVERISPGVFLFDLDNLAKSEILKRNAAPAFEGYRQKVSDVPFPAVLCASINSEVVHGPGNRNIALKEGDIIGLDLGLSFKGWFTDMAVTVPVGSVDKKIISFIKTAEVSLFAGIKAIKPGVALNEVSKAIYKVVTKEKFGVVTNFCGHGIGVKAHEEPAIPNYPTDFAERIILEEGMTLAIEPMITMGSPALVIDEDGWTARTADGSLGAHFEHTVAVTSNGAEILTKIANRD